MRKLDAAEMVQAVRRVEAPLALAVCGLEPRLRVVAIISLVIEVRAQNSPCFSGLIHHVFVVTLDVAISSIGGGIIDHLSIGACASCCSARPYAGSARTATILTAYVGPPTPHDRRNVHAISAFPRQRSGWLQASNDIGVNRACDMRFPRGTKGTSRSSFISDDTARFVASRTR
jgi:hypothetical protein